MDTNILHQKYLSQGTPGFAVIRRFYSRYSDLLVKANLMDFDDVVHEVFVSLSRTDFSQVQNIEHYVMRAIKLQCWSLLDKAVRVKTSNPETRVNPETMESNNVLESQPEHLTELEGMELLTQINLFKAQLNTRDTRLLNLLIDGAERSNMAQLLGLNMNTLDTNIRRLRIRLAGFLRDLGYTYHVLEQFDGS